jgi:hypothetical protein
MDDSAWKQVPINETLKLASNAVRADAICHDTSVT